MRFIYAIFLMAIILTSLPQKEVFAAVDFSDVPDDSWAVSAIGYAVGAGLISGLGDGNFGYGQPVTRAQFLALISNMFNWGESQAVSPTFADVLPDAWYFRHVEAAANRGIIDANIFGYAGGIFNPNEHILRQDMAVWLVRALGYSSLATQVEAFERLPFSDVSSYDGYIIIAHDIGMIGGIGGGQFAPYNTATREQAAAMITHVHRRLNAPLDWVHGFYAFASFHQRELIRDMNSVSFGWSRMEWSAEGGAWLNTSSEQGNDWVIPGGYELIINFPGEVGAQTQLSVFMDTSMGLSEMIACESSRNQAVSAIIDEATRVYVAVGRSPFDGVTINFEGLRGRASREYFTIFLTALEYRIRAAGLRLYVTVHPSTIDGIYFDGYDIRRIGELADRVILMAHDYHPRSLDGFLGTHWHRNAAITPIAEVYRALKAITDPATGVSDRSKIAIAFNFANIGWFIDENDRVVQPTPWTVPMDTALTRMAQPDTYFGWSNNFRNPYIIYTTETGEIVFLWHENYRSVYEKLTLARLFGITGASVWRIGMIPNAPEWDVWGNFR